MDITGPEIMKALPRLFAVNPLAQSQLEAIILTERLAASEAKVAELQAAAAKSPNGQPAERVPTKAETK